MLLKEEPKEQTPQKKGKKKRSKSLTTRNKMEDSSKTDTFSVPCLICKTAKNNRKEEAMMKRKGFEK